MSEPVSDGVEDSAAQASPAGDSQPIGAQLRDQLRSLKFKLFAVITLVFIGLDQITKILVVQHISYRTEEVKLISGFLSFVHAQNKGAAFGMMSDSPLRHWIFPVFTVVAVVLLLQMLWQLEKNDKFQSTAVALIMSGAIGNFIDRMHKGSVTDFIRVYTENPSIVDIARKTPVVEGMVHRGVLEWPSFNVADSAIVVGIGLFVLHYFIWERDEKSLEPDPPSKTLD